MTTLTLSSVMVVAAEHRASSASISAKHAVAITIALVN